LQQHLTTGNLATLGADLAACLRPLAEPEGLYSAYTDVVRRAVLVFCVQFTSVAGPREREDIVGAAETFARQRADHVLLRQLQPLTAQP
jgi:hypothetical protein